MRWVIGDIQGCAAELEDLLKAIRFDPARDEVWLAGDLVNRGPASLEVVRLWLDIGGRGVIGNHEVYALAVHAGLWPRKKDTLDPLFEAPDTDHLLAKLRALPVMVHLPAETGGREAFIVHAGVHPHWTDLKIVTHRLARVPHDEHWLLSEDVSFATRVRCCTAEGERSKWDGPPQGCTPPFAPWDHWYRGDALVVHGHWARRGHYRSPNTIGLDSACIYGGKLTAWCQEEDRIVQVPCRKPAGYR